MLGYAITLDGRPLTEHDSLEAAVANARLIAADMWAKGRPTLVRVVKDDRTISPLVSFG